MKIQKIYDKYKIMPNLQEHQLRVTAVASIICDNFQKPIDKKSIISACLLHDIGNIVKSDLQRFPEFLKPKGLKYWERVKSKFIEKYGNDDHLATYKIIEEVGVNQKTIKIVKAFGFSKGDKTYKINDFNIKIAVHSDHRVSPYGITSLKERFTEARKRYVDVPNPKLSAKEFDQLVVVWSKIEKQVFYHCKISPVDINDKNVTPLISKFRNFEIK